MAIFLEDWVKTKLTLRGACKNTTLTNTWQVPLLHHDFYGDGTTTKNKTFIYNYYFPRVFVLKWIPFSEDECIRSFLCPPAEYCIQKALFITKAVSVLFLSLVKHDHCSCCSCHDMCWLCWVIVAIWRNLQLLSFLGKMIERKRWEKL